MQLQYVPLAIEAASSAMRHLAAADTIDADELNKCTDQFVRSVEVMHAAPWPRVALC